MALTLTNKKRKLDLLDSLSTVDFPTPGIPVKLIINRLVMPNIPIFKGYFDIMY